MTEGAIKMTDNVVIGSRYRYPPHTRPKRKRPPSDDRDTPSNKPHWDIIKNSRRRKIEEGMAYRFSKLIIVWSPTEIVGPDTVVSLLARYDIDVVVRNRWIPNKFLPSQKDWGGAVAIFNRRRDARSAARAISSQMRSMNVIWFPHMIDLLMDAEIQHRDFRSKSTGVVISGKRSLERKQQVALKWELYKYGDVERLQFIQEKRTFGVICEVKYTYATQAIVAKNILNDKFFSGIGHISAEIQEEEEEGPVTDILAEAVRRIETVVNRM